MLILKTIQVLLVAFGLTLLGCAAQVPRSVINPTTDSVSLAGLAPAAVMTLVPPVGIGTPEVSLTNSPTATETITTTVVGTPTPTGTPFPTNLPRLPLRTDLPPMTLQDFPRPQDDNGLGIHFIASGYYDDKELDKEIARLQALHLKWGTVVYADENQLELAAQKFSQAGIMVVWRKTLRPYQQYSSWQRDIDILKKYNMPPYMQLYNEPELPAEWDNRNINMDRYFTNLIADAKDVYNAGGYPGIQFLDEDDLRRFINEIYARQGEALFHRMFFIPHAYGANHPPNYVEDDTGVLGFRTFATIFYKRLGFVPPFIVGEGGWKIGSQEDTRYPAITDELHRDYTLAVYNWFRSGKLSNGAKLPDYLFAFDMWMLAGSDEAGAWYDSFKGDRTLTINAVSALPMLVRKFSWDK